MGFQNALQAGHLHKDLSLPFGLGMFNTFLESDASKSISLQLEECVNQGLKVILKKARIMLDTAINCFHISFYCRVCNHVARIDLLQLTHRCTGTNTDTQPVGSHSAGLLV